jgi:hypothetical protein
MSLKIGDTSVSKVYIGSTEVSTIYVGASSAYTSGPTTTPPPLAFDLNYSCVGNTATVTANNYSGGINPYQINSSVHTSEANALDGAFSSTTTSKSYSNLYSGTYWVALKDSTNTKLAKSIVIGTCTTTTSTTTTSTTTTSTTTTTTTTTLPPLSFDISFECIANTGRITINNFSGGNGTYLANSSAYTSEANAIAGTHTSVTTSRTYSNLQMGTWWISFKDSIGNNTTRSIVISGCTTTTTTTTTTVAPTTTTTTTTTTVAPTTTTTTTTSTTVAPTTTTTTTTTTVAPTTTTTNTMTPSSRAMLGLVV